MNRSFSSVAIALIAVAPMSVAQGPTQNLTRVPLTFPTSDPVIKQIWAEGMDNSRTSQLAQVLFDSIGPRLTGSPGIKSASDWVISQYKSWGIEARREQYGTWRGWRRGYSHIDLIKPRVRSLEGTMLAWSPGTKGVPVTAPVIILPKFKDSTEFVKWLPQARGKIVLLSPALPTCRPAEDWARWGTAETVAREDSAVTRVLNEWAVMGDTITNADGQRVFRADSSKLYRGTGYSLALGTGTLGLRLEKAGVAGMISSRSKITFPNTNPPLNAAGGGGGRGGRGGGGRGAGGGPMNARGGGPSMPADPAGGRGGLAGGWGTIEIFETYNKIAPAVTLVCEDYSLLYRLAENHEGPTVRLDLDASLLGEVPAFNTIGVIKGTEKPNEYVMLSAHFDSWDGSSGATDNGTGTL
ncbi:MAG TPA: M28 family peptidase, partial [Gemmatimonadaceae bacterium]